MLGAGSGARRRAIGQTLQLLAATVAFFVMILPGPAGSAELPQTLKVIVPLPPGGAGDTLARLLGEQVAQTRGTKVLIENRPGAGSIIGTEAVARSAPDGGTLLINAPYLLIGPQVRKVNYDPVTGFVPVCYLVSSPGVFVVNSASPYRTLTDLLNAARAKPGELTLASVGPATAQHLGFERLRRAANVDITYVPYAGGAPAINALLGGHLTAVFAEYAPLLRISRQAHCATGHQRAAENSPTTICPPWLNRVFEIRSGPLVVVIYASRHAGHHY